MTGTTSWLLLAGGSLVAAACLVAIACAVIGWIHDNPGHDPVWDYQPRHHGVWPMPEPTADELYDQADAIDTAIDDGWDPDATSWNMVQVPDDRKRAWRNKLILDSDLDHVRVLAETGPRA